MVQIVKKLLLIALCASSALTIQAECTPLTGSPYFFVRSQSRNKVLQDVGSVGHTHLYDMDSCYGTFDVVLSYEKSFKGNNIITALFGPTRTNSACLPSSTVPTCKQCSNNDHHGSRTFNIQGSAVANRDLNAWLADYFYLPTDFSSTITFSPKISNTLIFLDYYQGFDEWLCGSYFRIYGPITFTRWDLGFCENVINRGTVGYTAGYFTPGPTVNAIPIVANTLLENFSAYAIGQVPPGLTDTLTSGMGVNPHPLRHAKLSHDSHHKTGFADLRFELGWDFWQTACSHLGVNIQGAAPTGNKPDSLFCFQPTIGNGKHWELGGGVTLHYNLAMNEAETKIFSFWLDANITHLFAAHQQRTFDLKNKPVSRYMLAERLGTPVVNLFGNTAPATGDTAPAGGVAPTLQFQGEFAPVANLTTTDLKVSIDIQADVVAWFNFLCCNWSLDIGYNYWGTSCEKIRLDGCKTQCDNLFALSNVSAANTWALKGDASVYGFVDVTTPVALSATESGATLTNGTNAVIGAPINSYLSTNAGIDNPLFAQTTAAGGPGTAIDAGEAPLGASPAQLKTSVNPITLSCKDINFTRNKGLSHKFFAHLSYTWDLICWLPYLGVGGSVESAPSTPGCCPSQCNSSCSTKNSCMHSANSLWSVWIKSGVSF